jgi:ribonuclease D
MCPLCDGAGVQHEYLASQRELEDFCEDIAATPCLAFDTEFVSEDTFRPELCLVQVAVGERLVLIDPHAVDDMLPFWELLVQPGRETIVHAGRQEFLFCIAATGRRPSGWFDVQVAAGFIGLEYPAAYSTLISKVLGQSVPKGETRTNWRRRPLTRRQLEYAVQDVVYLLELRESLGERIQALDREAWLEEELKVWQDQVAHSESRERWRRVSGIAGLNSRQLAIVRELWSWREDLAEERNSPPRRMLRDDLIVELARRQTFEEHRIRAIRGLERRNLQRHLPEIADRIRRACELDADQCPRPSRGSKPNSSQLNLLGQFLGSALGSICREAQLAPSLVGTAQDVRELVALRLGLLSSHAKTPSLAKGWRAEVVGHVIDELLTGKLSMRVHDPRAENPLKFE